MIRWSPQPKLVPWPGVEPRHSTTEPRGLAVILNPTAAHRSPLARLPRVTTSERFLSVLTFGTDLCLTMLSWLASLWLCSYHSVSFYSSSSFIYPLKIDILHSSGIGHFLMLSSQSYSLLWLQLLLIYWWFKNIYL